MEEFLLAIGMQCGSVKNFSNLIIENMRTNAKQSWYFLTPIKSTGKVGGLKEATVSLAFPILTNRDDISEAAAYRRLTPMLKSHEAELLKALRQRVIAQTVEFFPITFWANSDGQRTDRKNLSGAMVHILSAKIKITYRDSYFKKC